MKFPYFAHTLTFLTLCASMLACVNDDTPNKSGGAGDGGNAENYLSNPGCGAGGSPQIDSEENAGMGGNAGEGDVLAGAGAGGDKQDYPDSFGCGAGGYFPGEDEQGGGGNTTAGAGGDVGGAGGSVSSPSAAHFAEAIQGDAACNACLDGLKGSVKDGAGVDVSCDGILAKCDNDQKCQDFIAITKDASNKGENPNCRIEQAAMKMNGDTGLGNELFICAAQICGEQCGNLTLVPPTDCQ